MNKTNVTNTIEYNDNCSENNKIIKERISNEDRCFSGNNIIDSTYDYNSVSNRREHFFAYFNCKASSEFKTTKHAMTKGSMDLHGVKSSIGGYPKAKTMGKANYRIPCVLKQIIEVESQSSEYYSVTPFARGCGSVHDPYQNNGKLPLLPSRDKDATSDQTKTLIQRRKSLAEMIEYEKPIPSKKLKDLGVPKAVTIPRAGR